MKMKKSKIIVPALGLLLLSTAASVTGTVAWFTASKSVQLTAGQFAVVSTTGDLKVVATPGIGTQQNATTNTTIEPKVDESETVDGVAITYQAATLTDASVDLNKGVYYPYANGSKIAKYTNTFDNASESEYLRKTNIISQSGDPVTARTVSKVYSCFTWTYDFTFTPENGIYVGLFLDFAASTGSSVSDVTTTNSNDSYKGFRIGFFADDKVTVWSANRTAAESTYASAAGLTSAATASTAYSNAYQILATDNRGVVPEEGVAARSGINANATYPNYLGQFPVGDSFGNEKTLTIKCVAWFEGSDDDVVTTTAGVYDTVSALMKFEARNLA